MATALLLASCSSAAPDSPYRADFDEALSYAQSQFEKDALADYEISRDEYEEALDRYVKCVRDAGADVALVDQQGTYIYEISGDIAKYDGVADDCAIGTKNLIEPLYVSLFKNPEKEDPDELALDCFKRHDGVDDSVTVEQLREYFEISTDGGTLPFEIDADVFDLCMSNPQA